MCKLEENIFNQAKSWPFIEAKKLIGRRGIDSKGYALFETGYGPSGLPHIGTFGEVARTTYVRLAYEKLTGNKTKLIAFSDDMDALRKVPDNVPNREMLEGYIGYALTSVPDPFGCHDSFGRHNNEKLKQFLDSFGFEYEFQSATDWYKSGNFNDVLLKVLEHHEEILSVMLPSLREERAATYSPFLPVDNGRVLQVPIVEYRPNSGTVVYKDDSGKLKETSVTDGNCKLQWKVDWASRWTALGVDYEMSGKDLIDSVKLSSKICKIIGGTPPDGFNYELFLDGEGKKISKSKGNGLSVDDWLRYAPRESLASFMFASPKSAKKLHFDVIPRSVDDYLANVDRLTKQENNQVIDNPAWHIHMHTIPNLSVPISFSMLLNLASVCNTDDSAVLWGFIKKYLNDASPETMPYLDKLVKHAIVYYEDFIRANKQYRTATIDEKLALSSLLEALKNIDSHASADDIQAQVYEVGKKFYPDDLKSWFRVIYEVLFGQTEGPRIGSFAALYGLENFIELLENSLNKRNNES